jgi:hypothetical protein
MRLLSTGTISTANTNLTSAVVTAQGPLPTSLAIYATFAYGSSGTAVDAYVQTSFDGGTTWTDIAQFHFTTAAAKRMYNLSRSTVVSSIATPGDGALSSNTSVDGLLGSHYRVKWSSSGTYAGASSLAVDVSAGGTRLA